MPTDPLLILLPVLLVLSAIASGTETAMFGMTRSERSQLRRDAPRADRALAALLARPRLLLLFILLCNMTVNVTYFVVTSIVTLRAESGAVQVGVSVGSILAIIVFGEVLAKVVATRQRVLIGRIIARPMHALQVALLPLLVGLDRLVISPLTRLVQPRAAHSLTARELSVLVGRGATEGVITDLERQLLERVVTLGSIRVRQVMTPRVDMKSVTPDATLADVLAALGEEPEGAIPVCKTSIDDGIQGLLDVSAYLACAGGPEPRIDAHIQPSRYVPEAVGLDRLLDQFRSTDDHVAICVDESGVVTGQVEIEDVVARIVGTTRAEDGAQQSAAELTGLGEWEAPGRFSLVDLESQFAEQLKGVDSLSGVSTIAGLIMRELGRLPDVGESTSIGALRLTVIAVGGRAISRVRISLLDPPESVP